MECGAHERRSRVRRRHALIAGCQRCAQDIDHGVVRVLRSHTIAQDYFSPRSTCCRHVGVNQLDDLAGVHPGERWLFTVRLKRPHGSVNPYGFDYEAWLLERGIGATGYVRQRGEQKKIGQRSSPGDRVEQIREAVRTRFLAVLGETTTAGILVALAVGDQRAIDAEDWRLFSRTGVTHLMSISGLHVTLISGLAAALVSFGWRRSSPLVLMLPARKAAAVAATLAAFAYTVLAGFGVPAQRTLFMVGAVAAALWFGRIS